MLQALHISIPKRDKKEGLVEYAERLSNLYSINHSIKHRKQKGQFFTPHRVGKFMANMFEIKKNSIRILDPGAGTGVLSAAFCERLIKLDSTFKITMDTYENDIRLLPFLRATLESCKEVLGNHGSKVNYNIYEQDFILNNVDCLNSDTLLWQQSDTISYDFAISNPPYYKLDKNSPQALAMKEWVCSQPNIYTLFMTLSASMLKPGGQMVFITPRSFCSGLYYKKFRRWFLTNVKLSHIHLFESRKEIFDKDDILQENIILKVKKQKKQIHDRRIVISTSRNKHFEKVKKITVPETSVICNKTEESLVRIPSCSVDLAILDTVERWPVTLRDLGLEVSTGLVVAFRAKKFLTEKIGDNGESVPLLWMHNMKGMRTVWPANKNKKPSAIKISTGSERLLLPVENYVLLRRFSSKEQARRLHATVFFESEFPYRAVGIENHLNYLHKHGGLSIDEAHGLSTILNTSIVDNYFRLLNGNTQVNATDIRSLPFPEMKDIRTIGRIVREKLASDETLDPDSIISKITAIDSTLINALHNKDN